MPRPRKFDWDEAARLREEGLSYAAIGDRLEVSVEGVRRVLIPHVRERMAAYSARWQAENKPWVGVCPDCGGPASNRLRQGTRCRACHAKHAATSVRPDMLRCCLCRLWLPDDEFGPAKRHPLRRGRHIECKPCQAARKRDFRAANAEHYRAYERDRRRRAKAAS